MSMRISTGRVRLLLAALPLLLTACASGPEAASLSGVTRTMPLEVGHVVLPEVTDAGFRAGGVSEQGDLRFVAADGRVLLVYFGFTSCPDVCPATLVDLRLALQRITAPDRVDLVFVTVDPDRDTPEVLNEYLPFFSERFHAVRTEDPEQLQAAADAFLARYQVAVDSDGEVEVSHTAVLYAVGPDGRVLVEWPFGTMPEQIAGDLDLILAGAR